MESRSEVGSTWPPVWKAIEESHQYLYGFLLRYEYLREYLLKRFADVECKPSSYYKALEFIDQIITNRCYDFDYYPPELYHLGLPLHKGNYDIEPNKSLFETNLNFAVAKINQEAEMHGEYYEYLGVVTAVEAIPHRSIFITMSAMNIYGQIKTVQAMVGYLGCRRHELAEWRFKPDTTSVP